MGQLSKRQMQLRSEHLKTLLTVGVTPVVGDRLSVRTKETIYKRASLPDSRAREGSPFEEAASSQAFGLTTPRTNDLTQCAPLALPNWWEAVEPSATVEQTRATILANLQQAQQRRERKTWKRPVWRAL
jgi:hypothetical protein